MELILHNTNRKLEVSDLVFGYKFNQFLVHQVVVAYNAKSRQGTSAQKSRSEVIGSGRKPWRQKGTGRARSGSVKSPIWRSGGVTFAAKSKDYSQKVNKKMYRNALKSILSELIRQHRLIIVKDFIIPEPRTKVIIQKIRDFSIVKDSVLILVVKLDRNLVLAARNIYWLNICSVLNATPVNLINSRTIIITASALLKFEEILI